MADPKYLERLREIDDEVDAAMAPSAAHAARQWVDDDETLDDMVRRGVAIPIEVHGRRTDNLDQPETTNEG